MKLPGEIIERITIYLPLYTQILILFKGVSEKDLLPKQKYYGIFVLSCLNNRLDIVKYIYNICITKGFDSYTEHIINLTISCSKDLIFHNKTEYSEYIKNDVAKFLASKENIL
jgi:hypothetical protein